MGKPGGFLDFLRKDPGYRPVDERLEDYHAVELRLGDAEIRAQAARCMDCGTPFCHGCGCPLSNIIPEMNDLAYQGRWKEALDLLLETNSFPEFTGRICPAPCETACVLGINDDAVTIRQIELAVIEKGFEKGYLSSRSSSKRINKAVAVVGSGPAGLAVADRLNRAGCNVTVFDKAAQAGGVLRYGIPDFKLEKSIVDRRIRLMEAEGIEFELGVSVGHDVSCKYLRDRFSAICLAGGSREPRNLAVPGRDLKGIHFAMQYLTQQNQRLAGEEIPSDAEISAKDKNVLIIGGGDTGSDCLGTALRQGAKMVYQFEILPKPPEERPESSPWPEWPNTYRETSSHKEGGERRWCVSTTSFSGTDCVERAHLTEVEWSKDADGNHVMKEKAGSDFEIDVDLVLLSMGFVGPGPNPLVDELKIALDDRRHIKIDDNHMTSEDGIFAAGDMAHGQSLVVRALSDGRSAADGILKFLKH